ncbi:MAG: 5-(carboxyamino)imidazole ribonucleotide synthase [Chloroflexota bacterium]
MKFAMIGILGGGQLGRMLAQAAQRMGMSVAILDPDPDSPAIQIAQRYVIGSFRDPAKIRKLAQGCDVVTTEIEHVDVETLEALEQSGINVQSPSRTIRIIQDKFGQKVYLAQHNIPLPAFCDIPNVEAAYRAAETFGFPFVLKAKRLAYDGRGNYVVRNLEDIPLAMASFGAADLYAEQWVPFTKELAVMVARSIDGQIAVYPVVETVQVDNICHTVIAPAQISPAIAAAASEIARAAVASLEGVGIFGVELFLLPDDSLLLNEIAPRPHNSGHYTIEACVTSQFEQHIRAITRLPLGDPAMRVPAAIMLNLIGQATSQATEMQMDAAISLPEAAFHWYGKRELRPGRKLGHVTVTGLSLADVARKMTPLTNLTEQTDLSVGKRLH